jgi:hypothetical protein
VRRYIAFTCGVAALARTLATLSAFGASGDQGTKSDDGVKLEFRSGRPVVDGVYVNGHGPYRFLFDTGATLNHLDPAVAQAAGLPVTFHTTLVSSTGTAPAPGSDGGEVGLGPVHADHQTFLFAGIDALRAISPDIQGVLGQAFLSRFDYLIDVRHGRLEFRTPPPATGTRVPFQRAKGRPLVSTSLGSLLLDTGAPDLIRFGVQAPPADGTRTLVTVSGATPVGVLYSTLVIAGRTFWRGEAVAVPRSPERDVDGLLALAPFKAIYVCNSEGYVVLE